MKIALVLCPFWDTKYPPLSLALLSSVLNNTKHEVIKYDLNRSLYQKFSIKHRNIDLWKVNSGLDADPAIRRFISDNTRLIDSYVRRICESDVIGFTVFARTRLLSLEIAKRIKKKDPGKIIIFGGPECFKYESPGAFIKEKYVDFVVVGEGEEVLPALISSLIKRKRFLSNKGVMYKKNEEIHYTGDRPPLSSMGSMPTPDFSGLLKLYKGGPIILPIQASRGCINHCTFCNEGLFWKKFKSMSGDRIFKEIKQLVAEYGADQFVFHDSLINGDMKALIRFCDLMIRHKLELIMSKNNNNRIKNELTDILWTGQALVRKEMTPDILKKMKLAGCYRLSYGIETGSKKILTGMNKNFTIDQAKKVLKYTHDAGIIVQMNLMFGFPTEKEADFDKTVKFFKEVRPWVDMIAPAPAFIINKGTLLHKYPDKFGISEQDDSLYWESDNGKNNYWERFKRYEKFCNIAAESGIPEEIDLYKEHPYKRVLLSKYLGHIACHKQS